MNAPHHNAGAPKDAVQNGSARDESGSAAPISEESPPLPIAQPGAVATVRGVSSSVLQPVRNEGSSMGSIAERLGIPAMMGTRNPAQPQHVFPPQQASPPRQTWSVPNPLGASCSSPAEQLAARQQQQIAAQQQQIQQRQQQLQQQQQALQQQARTEQQQQPKMILSPETKQALAKAIWSAIRDPEGKVDPELMQAAVKAGVPQHAILNAARVAREKEAQKRLQQHHASVASSSTLSQQPSSSQSITRPSQQFKPVPTGSTTTTQQQQEFRPPSVQRPSATHSSQSPRASHLTPQQQQHQQFLQQQQQAMYHQQQATAAAVAAAAAVASQQNIFRQQQKQQQQQQQLQLSKEADDKNNERSFWKRLQHGTFMNQKGRFLAVPYSFGGMARCKDLSSALTPLAGRKRPAPDMFADALTIQKLLKERREAGLPTQESGTSVVTPLLDPSKFKRFRVEPKKHTKALDRVARKSRQNVAETLTRQHKELCKALSSHQTEFFKFHRQRKADAYKLAKTIRDSFDKEEKKREKDVAQQERARLAALKANDMTAYSKLLEETKNERLKYLLDKTERHFSQISSLLQNQRVANGGPDSATNTAATSSYYSTAHSFTEEVRQPTILVGGDLKAYQLSGLQWLVSLYNNNLNGILADEMGLGKTIQAISVIAYLMEFKQNLGPYLVIVPLSTLSNWQNEFAKWCPAARTICYKGTKIIRKDIFKNHVEAGQFNVLLTTYEYIIKDKKFLKRIDWQYAIVDEGHRMKNAESKFAVTLGTQYSTRYRVLLTGTPLMNDLSELWSLLNFLLPAVFNSSESFDSWFSAPFAQFSGSNQGEEEGEMLLSNEERILVIHRLHELLRPFMLRRVKSEVLDQLPEKVEKVLRCELSSWQKELYKQISQKAVVDTGGLGSTTSVPNRGLNNIVMQLRKVCNHPYLFTPEGYHINDTIIRSSGKFALLDQMLPKLKLAGHRVLMFTQMTAVMTILEDYFALRGYLSLRLDGSTPAEEREKRMHKFNAPDSPYFIFLLSTRAGGLGLNLTSADTVIIFDSDWNPMQDLQAQDRAHRIGQRSDVSVFRLITNSPVEEQILARASEKLNVAELVVESGKFNNESVENDTSMERKRIMEVLMTDFDKSHQQKGGISERSSDNGDDDDDESTGSDKEDPNELLSNNEADYQLYTKYDEQREKDGYGVPPLFTEEADVPEWIRHPQPFGTKGSLARIDEGPRKRTDVTYDDGLTEKQFLRLMDKQVMDEEKSKAKAKPGRVASASKQSSTVETEEELLDGIESNSNLTDWTFRKLISCTKSVVALKDPGTKRRLSEIFLEKPEPSSFPDYYEIIEKPIAINDILRKCRAKIYTNIPEYREDWNLMFANARKFNGEDSWVVVDAMALEKELERVLKKNGFSDGTIPVGKKKKLRINISLKDIK